MNRLAVCLGWWLSLMASPVWHATAAGHGPGAECGPVRFAVISDLHVYDTRLGTTGAAFEAYLAYDPKLLRESEAILEAAVDGILDEGVDFVIVSGDMTKDGELASHLKCARQLSRLERHGIQVCVVPGNHDVNNPHAVAYSGDETTRVPNVSPSLFQAIYRNFGYRQAIEQDPASLSYLAEPVRGLWLLALDTCIYDGNDPLGGPVTAGRLSAATLDWAKEKLAEAEALGKKVVAFGHHGLLEHYAGQTIMFPDYVVQNWQQVSQELSAAGLRAYFSGHFHAHDATAMPFGLTDVETAALVTYPSAYRIVTVSADGHATGVTARVEAIDYDTGGVPFEQYALAHLYEGLILRATYQLIMDFGLTPEEAAILAPVVASAFLAHYSGDEAPDAEALWWITYLLSSSDPTAQFLGLSLFALWTDIPPADATLSLDLLPAPVP